MICSVCKCEMVGYPGDDICSDCAFPALAKASKAAAKAVEEDHFKRTGEVKTCGQILRETIFKM